MKNPHDLCRVEYYLYRRQMHQIRHLAQTTNQHPSEIMRYLLDHALADNTLNADGGR